MSVTVTYRADPKFKNAMARDVLPVMLTKLAMQVETEAKRLCPVDTGNLRRSISSALAMEAGLPVAHVRATAHYAAYVELGTRNQRPQPFLRPALERVIRGVR